MNLAVLGINFKTAPLELREQASFRASEIPGALQRMAAAFPGAGLVLLSTCNRTELYLAGVDVAASRMDLARSLLKNADAGLAAAADAHFYVKTGIEAAEHLLTVASSLDSMVVGETEILGQVKQAFALAGEAGTQGRKIPSLFHHAFRCAKRVHAETDISRGRVSVSSVAVEFAERVFEDLSAKTVMIVGAGEMAELALKSLVEHGAREVLVLNRSMENGQALAGRHGGRAIPFELLDDYLPQADIIISSTSAPHAIIRAAAVRRAMEIRRGRPVLLVDIAMPRDIEPAAGEVKDVYLYHIDDLQRVAAENLARRQEAVERAWQIVREVSGEWADLFKVRNVGAVMAQLDAHGREVCESILTRYLAKEKLAALPEPCKEEIRELARKIVSKMLAAPRETLRQAAKDGEWEAYAKIAPRLLGLDRKEEEPKEEAQDKRL
ncbi:MAG: glutamyl-tRNA reductase [bacterium]